MDCQGGVRGLSVGSSVTRINTRIIHRVKSVLTHFHPHLAAVMMKRKIYKLDPNADLILVLAKDGDAVEGDESDDEPENEPPEDAERAQDREAELTTDTDSEFKRRAEKI